MKAYSLSAGKSRNLPNFASVKSAVKNNAILITGLSVFTFMISLGLDLDALSIISGAVSLLSVKSMED